MVECLEGHARGQGAVADHRDRLALDALQLGGNGHAQGSADGGAGVTDAKGVVFALAAAREGGQAVLLAQAGHAFATTGEDLVRIGLVAHVPHQPVFRGVEDVMQGHGQFDDAQAGAEVTAGLAHGPQEKGAQFVGDGFQLGVIELAQLHRRVDAVEQGRRGTLAGNLVKRLGHLADHFAQRIRQFTRCSRGIPTAGRASCYAPVTTDPGANAARVTSFSA